jgi:DHA2 family multidrug resistance protein
VSITGFYYFFAHSLTTTEPFIRFELFNDRNFVGGCIFMVVIGIVLFATMALITPFMQNLLGYPILTAGWLLGARGVGTLCAMLAVNRLMKWTEARNLVGCGLLLTAYTLWEMTGFTTDTTAGMIVGYGVVQGVGLGLVFVPLSSVSFLTIAPQLRTSGSAILTLLRNIGSSIGISMVIANLTSKTSYMHAVLGESITPFNNALQNFDVASNLNVNTDTGRAMLDNIVTQQAAVIAYQNDFKLLMYLTLASLPLLLVLGSARKTKRPAGVKPAEVHVLD